MASVKKVDPNQYMRVEGGVVCPYDEEAYKKEPRLVMCEIDGKFLEKPRIGDDIIEASGFPISGG